MEALPIRGRFGPSAPRLSVIIDAQRGDADEVVRIRDAVRSASMDAQIIVANDGMWPGAPEGVEVCSYASASRGDRFDAAARMATGDLLAFIDGSCVVPPGWAAAAVRLFDEDPALTVAGGPVLLSGRSRSERIGAAVMGRYLQASPASHNVRLAASRSVKEVGVQNLVIRAVAFRQVGGFQSPAGAHGEAVRLSYKVRTILHGTIRTEPSLAVRAAAPPLTTSLLADIATYGRCRGGLARRLPRAAPLVPYGLPSLLTLGFAAAVALAAVPPTRLLGLGLLGATLAALVVLAVATALRSGPGSGALEQAAAVGLFPLVIIVYGATFLRGYLGHNPEETSPPRERTRPLRVLILNWRDVTHPHSGGAETYMHQIAKRWAASGIEVGWLTQRHAGAPREETIDGVRIHRVGGRLTQYPRAALRYLTGLRQCYDVLVDCENGIPFFCPFYSRKPKVLVVHHVHQEIFRTQLPAPARPLALWLEGRLMPFAYRRAEVVAVSEGTRSDLIGLGFAPEQVSVVTNGVIPPAVVEHRPDPSPRIMCMGRLAPQKSVDVLLRALPVLLERLGEVHVDIIGQGPDRRRLEQLAWTMGLAEHVTFHGYVSAAVRDDLASRAWLSACTSSFEGWGVVCMEASARGLPVVASDVPGLRESVRDGSTGRLFPYGDHVSLASTLGDLLGDAAELERMGAEGRAWAAQHTWDGSAEAFATILASLRVVAPPTVMHVRAPELIAPATR